MTSKLIAGLVLVAGTLLAGPRFSVEVAVGGPAYSSGYAPDYYDGPQARHPGPGYAWVEGYWYRDRGYRVWRPGYWVAPRRYVTPRWRDRDYDRDGYRDRREDRREDRWEDRREDRRYRR